ncbi:MAG TPA: oxygenase MpaB family protein [Thermoanaerobaculia bacterium]|nr:oxygenase MpaB family protein [Thermoanaerobaculia bacterium]
MSLEHWPDELFDRMRDLGDPVTDPLIAQVLADGGPDALARLNRFLQTWDAPLSDQVPAGVRAFLAAPLTYPDWVDEAQLARGQELFRQHAPETLLILFFKSLPQYFANANSDLSFARADVFNPSMVRRLLLEITQLLLDVAVFGALRVQPEKTQAVYAMQKLRLHHSVVRLWVLPDPRLPPTRELPPWQPEWGAPINQEDLAGAVAAFTVWDLEGLAELGLELPPPDREATLMYWRVLAWLLGMEERLQPRDLEDTAALLAAIDRRQFRPSEDGTRLVRQLLAIPQGFLPSFLDSLPVWAMRRLMAPRFVVMLRVPRPSFAWGGLLAVLHVVLGKTRLVRQVAKRLGKRFLLWARTAEGRHGERGRFRFPPEVEERVLGKRRAA